MTDDHDGTYRATITNTTAELVTVSAEFGGNPVVSTADVTFVPLTTMIVGGITYNGVLLALKLGLLKT